ncbi:MAG: hypothetical protein ACF8NJ_03345 [Phycisphaerales bacterium JB038]
MNVTTFFNHWGIAENPFRAEEARHDAVFARLRHGPSAHPDFEKISGEFDQPATSIVFGEKGSGKTAIRLRIERDLDAFNEGKQNERCFFIAYDDLNPVLDRFHRSVRGGDPSQSLPQFRLVDHMDAILHLGVSTLVDGLRSDAPESIDLGPSPARTVRKGPPEFRRDLLLLQACYDRAETAHQWTGRLARLARRKRFFGPRFFQVSSIVLVVAAVVLAIYWSIVKQGGAEPAGPVWPWLAGGIVAGLLGVGAMVKWLRSWWRVRHLAGQLGAQIRISDREGDSYYRSLVTLRPTDLLGVSLPTSDSDDVRYEMLARLKRVLRTFGYSSLLIIIDRVDEPTLVNGDVQRMKALIWPLMNSKFLQQDRLGLKLLLPLELRHELFRESNGFFQVARLDKQNLVERLTWSGATLYDLCNARLRACLRPEQVESEATPAASTGSEVESESDAVAPIPAPAPAPAPVEASLSLSELFAEDVSRQDVVDALDQMHQPRDAFKLLYQCIHDHCSNVTEEDAAWRIPRLILDHVRTQQAGRVQELQQGLRPA